MITILMKLEEICSNYEIPKQKEQAIKKELTKDENFNLEYVQNALSEYPISLQDIEELSDQFAETDIDILALFLSTRVNIAKYKKAESQRYGASVTARTDVGLVLSNKNGSEKVYLMYFHNLSEKDFRRLIKIVNKKKSGIQYLMTKAEINRLTTK